MTAPVVGSLRQGHRTTLCGRCEVGIFFLLLHTVNEATSACFRVVQTPRPETYTQLDPTTGQGVSGKRKAGKVLGQGGAADQLPALRQPLYDDLRGVPQGVSQ